MSRHKWNWGPRCRSRTCKVCGAKVRTSWHFDIYLKRIDHEEFSYDGENWERFKKIPQCMVRDEKK